MTTDEKRKALKKYMYDNIEDEITPIHDNLIDMIDHFPEFIIDGLFYKYREDNIDNILNT